MMMNQLPIDIRTRMIRVPRATKSPPFPNASRPYGLSTVSLAAGSGGGVGVALTSAAAAALLSAPLGASAEAEAEAGVWATAIGAETVAAEIIRAAIKADKRLRVIDILILQIG